MTKKKKPEDLETRGRKTVMTPKIIDKLEQAFALGCADVEACLFANIGKSTLYTYQNAHPDFSERKQQLKESLTFKARTVIADALERKDENTAKWYLERRAKNEFSTRQEVTGADGESLIPVIEIQPVKTKD